LPRVPQQEKLAVSGQLYKNELALSSPLGQEFWKFLGRIGLSPNGDLSLLPLSTRSMSGNLPIDP
jgi:hypothetical protein